MLGQEVAKLVDGEQQNAGFHEARFNAAGMSSGLYFYKISAGSFSNVQKMVLLK
jgi:hypothetical protein